MISTKFSNVEDAVKFIRNRLGKEILEDSKEGFYKLNELINDYVHNKHRKLEGDCKLNDIFSFYQLVVFLPIDIFNKYPLDIKKNILIISKNFKKLINIKLDNKINEYIKSIEDEENAPAEKNLDDMSKEELIDYIKSHKK